MACGLALSHVVEGVSPKGLEAMVGGSLIALGALLVMHQRIYGAFALGLIGATAFAHGVAHARELPPHAVAGVLLATLALHAAGIALGLALRSRTRAAGMLVGGATAALGSALLAGLA
jgi:urease accessory protein